MMPAGQPAPAQAAQATVRSNTKPVRDPRRALLVLGPLFQQLGQSIQAFVGLHLGGIELIVEQLRPE